MDALEFVRVRELEIAVRIWNPDAKRTLIAWHRLARHGGDFAALARELGVIHQLLPDLEPLYTCDQDPEWHPEGTVWTHTLMVIDQARRLNADLDRARLAAQIGETPRVLAKINESTVRVVDFLSAQPAVKEVYWALRGESCGNYYRLARSPQSVGGMISFTLRTGIDGWIASSSPGRMARRVGRGSVIPTSVPRCAERGYGAVSVRWSFSAVSASSSSSVVPNIGPAAIGGALLFALAGCSGARSDAEARPALLKGRQCDEVFVTGRRGRPGAARPGGPPAPQHPGVRLCVLRAAAQFPPPRVAVLLSLRRLARGVPELRRRRRTRRATAWP